MPGEAALRRFYRSYHDPRASEEVVARNARRNIGHQVVADPAVPAGQVPHRFVQKWYKGRVKREVVPRVVQV